MRLVLASGSPRRRDLLRRADIAFEAAAGPEVDETPPAGASPDAVVRALAERKVRASLPAFPGCAVLCADTLVFLDDEPLGKPGSPEEAVRMLARLSGRAHRVLTGAALGIHAPDGTARVLSRVDATRLVFRDLPLEEIRAYVATGEPLDKAGAYGLQGGAAAFVSAREGAEDTVIGLHVPGVRALMGELGL